MSNPDRPPHRTAVIVTIVIGYMGSAIVAVLALTGGFGLSTSLPAALGVASFAALPPTLALASFRDRPRMLLLAAVTALGSIVVLSLVGVVLACLGVVWILVYATSGSTAPRSVLGLLIPLLFWATAGFALLIHIDPVCERTFDDGRTESYDPADDGLVSGWIWSVDNSTVSGTGSSQPGEVASQCSSNQVVWAEAMASIGFSLLAFASAWSLERPDH